jgi:NAD(P)-dependent dehydrogenase (short-subunit alcohol dehydrogenase family)
MASAPRVALVSVDPFIFLFPDGRFRSVSWQNSLRQVTGSNKGIGFAIVRGLCRQLKDQGIVYLAGAVPFLFFRINFFKIFFEKSSKKRKRNLCFAARNEQLGLEAVKLLEEENLHPKFIRLDINDVKSIEEARDVIKREHGGLDILVNNAAIAFKVLAHTRLIAGLSRALSFPHLGSCAGAVRGTS